MRMARVFAAVAVTAFTLNGCAQNVPSELPAVSEKPASSADGLANSRSYLFATDGRYVYEFAPNSTKPLRMFSSRGEVLAVDHSGKLYSASFDRNTIQVYAPGNRRLLNTIHMTGAEAMAFDSRDDLYAANTGEISGCPAKQSPPGVINVYDQTSVKARQTIDLGGLAHAFGLAVDQHDSLYADLLTLTPNSQCPPGIKFSNPSVTIYGHGSTTPTRIITRGVPDAPSQPLMDAFGGFYLFTNTQKCSTCNVTGRVIYFRSSAQSSTSTWRTPRAITGLALGRDNELYVDSYDVQKPETCIIAEFKPRGVAQVKSIAAHVSSCQQLAVVDSSTHLYIVGQGLHGYEYVTVIDSSGGGPARTLPATRGVLAIALGPQ